jgi:ribonuclease HI
MVMKPETKRKGTPSPSHPIWIPPPGNWAKINVDAGVARSGEHGVVVAVARSASGVYLGGSAVLITGISNPEVLEALAVREGLNLAQDLLLTKVRLASDCLSVINALKEENWGSYSQILQEIKRTSRDLEEVSFVHENRLSNKEPHDLGKFVLGWPVGRYVWLSSPPVGVCIPCLMTV